jgi:hypothetical protein
MRHLVHREIRSSMPPIPFTFPRGGKVQTTGAEEEGTDRGHIGRKCITKEMVRQET